MQRMWKQSPKQSVGLHDIRLHTKKAPLPKITWTYRGAAAPPPPPGSATGGQHSHNHPPAQPNALCRVSW